MQNTESRLPVTGLPSPCRKECPTVPDSVSPPSPEAIAGHVRGLILALGEDPESERLKNTPERMARAFRHFVEESSTGTRMLFESGITHVTDAEMVVVRNIRFAALCQHYLMPFSGRVHIAVLPNDRTIDAHALTLLVTQLARGLQSQERLTNEIRHSLEDTLSPRGVAVLMEARHTSNLIFEAESHDVEQTTFVTTGDLRAASHQTVLSRLRPRASKPGRYPHSK